LKNQTALFDYSEMAPLPNAGVFQSIDVNKNSIIIHDKLYGEHTITEPVLVQLLQCPELVRLKGVCQHGITGLLGFTPQVTRFEHSVGAFLLVRKVGGSLEEQVAALLHDVSHTALSHVIDYALSKPGEGSFHEVHKARYLKKTTLPEILTQHGFGDLKAFEEDLFPLVEMPSPQLCADRLDYSLRDTVAFGKLSMEDAQQVFATLRAFPSASSPRRLLVLGNPQLALTLARAYMAADRDVWSNRAHVDIYKRTGQIIGELVKQGFVEEEALWSLSDKAFWALLRHQATPEISLSMDRLETEGLPREEGLKLPQFTKIRTIDPDVCEDPQGKPSPLSMVLPEWGLERHQYILSRQATQEK
jgi:HD superfamily phosphohydrolase